MAARNVSRGTSALEKDLATLLRDPDEDRMTTLKEMMDELRQMSDRKVIITSYPACNSG